MPRRPLLAAKGATEVRISGHVVLCPNLWELVRLTPGQASPLFRIGNGISGVVRIYETHKTLRIVPNTW